MKKIYSLITYFYNFVSTIIENSIYRKSVEQNEFMDKGYCKIYDLSSANLDYEKISLHKVNEYYQKLILSEDELIKLINNIFLKDKLCNQISKLTGFCYSIDFFTAYETSNIPLKKQGKGWYANHPHKDKPYSKNTIKLIIPLHKISNIDGPMKIIDKNKSKNFLPNNNLEFQDVVCDLGEAFLFNPNICYHYASNPEKDRKRKQMMFQLNPSKKWKINLKICDYQKIREPKFPFFSYLFDSKKNLDLINF